MSPGAYVKPDVTDNEEPLWWHTQLRHWLRLQALSLKPPGELSEALVSPPSSSAKNTNHTTKPNNRTWEHGLYKRERKDIGNEWKGWRSKVSLVWTSALNVYLTEHKWTGMAGTPEIPALRRLIKEDHNFQNINKLGTQVHAFKSSTGKAEAGESSWVWGQVYIASPRPARATYCGTLPQKQTNKIKYNIEKQTEGIFWKMSGGLNKNGPRGSQFECSVIWEWHYLRRLRGKGLLQ